ncbi:MAG: AraC family transcriptional regulator [Planctomycetota bacterium]
MQTSAAIAKRAKELVVNEGFNETCLGAVRIHLATSPIDRQPILYDSWIVALLQGEKTLHVGERRLLFDREHVLCVIAGTQVECEAAASPEHPLLSIVIEVNTEELLAMAPKIAASASTRASDAHVMDLLPMTDALRAAFGRLVEHMHDPAEARVLGEGTIREIVFRVLRNGLAESLVALAANRNTAAILGAIRTIQAGYRESLSIDQLAQDASMSASAFHAHFKKTTGRSPLSYIKGVRLGRAQELIGSGRSTVSEAAYAVGYNSASQFSREYKRHFGQSPVEHVPSVDVRPE